MGKGPQENSQAVIRALKDTSSESDDVQPEHPLTESDDALPETSVIKLEDSSSQPDCAAKQATSKVFKSKIELDKGKGHYRKIFRAAEKLELQKNPDEEKDFVEKKSFVEQFLELHKKEFANEMPLGFYHGNKSVKVTPLIVLFETLAGKLVESREQNDGNPVDINPVQVKAFKKLIDFYKEQKAGNDDIHHLIRGEERSALKCLKQMCKSAGRKAKNLHGLMKYLENACLEVTPSPATVTKEKPSENNGSTLSHRLLAWLHKSPTLSASSIEIESATSMRANTMTPSGSDSARSSAGSNSQATENQPSPSSSSSDITFKP